ncbi:MAG: energy transducer TonB [Candidatus Latescibacteria bacterium]|nr:energy transducer TonB [Candidatus Latescibacterota bacterium]
MNRVAVMTFPDALKKKPFQEANWPFLGVALISLIILSTLVTLGNHTLNFAEPVLSEDAASYYVDLILGVEEKIAPLEEVKVETEELAVGAETVDEEFAEEPEEMDAAPEEPAVEAQQRQEAVREERRQAAGARVAKAKEAQAAALESSGLLAMLTVATPTGGARTSGTKTTSSGGVGAFGVSDLGTEFGVSADLSKDRRVASRVKGSKKEIKAQIKKGRALEAKMGKADIEAAETLSDAQIEVKMSGPTKVDEIAEATAGRGADAIEAMITQHRAQIAYCYQRELKSNPGLKGKIVVRFTVRANGRITGAKVIQSTMGNAKVERCIVGIIRRFRFEAVGKEKGNLTYEYPFMFSPK